MKYFKFAQISADTGISWVIEQPISGPSYPPLPGLNVTVQLMQDRRFYLGTVDDSAVADPANYIFELTPAEYAEELKPHVEAFRQERLDRIYPEEKEFRQSVFGKYDDTASIAGIYKYQEAIELLADPTAPAPEVRNEAAVRGVDPIVMAERIVANHEAFRDKESKIAGIRGMVYDRLTNFVFDLNAADASYAEFFSQEKIGERTENRMNPETGVMEDTVVDVMVGKYVLAIGARFQYLG
jgi:hypothetical protein